MSGPGLSAGEGLVTEDVQTMATEIATLLTRAVEFENRRKRTLYRMRKALMDLGDYIRRKNIGVDVVDDERVGEFRLELQDGTFGIRYDEDGVLTEPDYMNDNEIIATYRSGRLVPFLKKIAESVATEHDSLQEFISVVEAIERSLQEVDE